MHTWKKVLIGVDDTATSLRAVQYAGHVLGEVPEARCCLLHVYPSPPPDYYRNGATLAQWQAERQERGRKIVAKATAVLQEAGIPASAITTDLRMADTTLSQTILQVQDEGAYGTVVVGRRGLSKAEEFLFGSISSALVHHCEGCTIWVVG